MEIHDKALDGPKMSKEDYDRLPETQKLAMVKTRHLGIIKSCERYIAQNLHQAMSETIQGPDGSLSPRCRIEDLVVVLMHRDDHITPPEIRETLRNQKIEVAVFVSEREAFAEGLLVYTLDNKTFPYEPVGRGLKEAPPAGTFYTTVLDSNMCTLIFLGFDREAIAAAAAPAQVPAPAPVQEIAPPSE